MGDEAAVRREVTLALEDFGRTSLESRAQALNVPVAAIVRQAALYYLAVRGSDRAAIRVPRFARERTEPERGLNITIALDEAEWGALEVEAVHERVELERLITHAALLFLSDVDSGVVALHIAGTEEEH